MRKIHEPVWDIELKNDFLPGYLGRGDVYIKTEKYDKAILDYTKAIELETNNVDLYIKRSTIFKMLNQLEKSDDDLDSAIRKLNQYIYFHRHLCQPNSRN